ncbi:MAG TPA: CheR family methyltransferase [Vicinamibacterales bacterium]|nr:CheR family methyltransferase [Vicinamibacterales bacterium]
MALEIEQLLRDTIGLDADSIGRPTLDRAILERRSACGSADVRAYTAQVWSSKEELQALIEAVVVPETWFFRDPGAFDALSAVVRHGALPMATEPLRLLSVPSSSGEEPYSMAMALLDAGVPSARFQVDAMDISLRALERAAAAVYGRNSFRGSGTTGREHHFETVSGGRRVCQRVRRQVRFRHGNLLQLPYLPGRDRFDVIFCRNLLIYFDRSMQDRAIAALGSLLKPEGLLFVGSSEGGLALSHDYVSAKLPMAFAFRRPQVARPARAVPRSVALAPPPPPPLAPVMPSVSLDDARSLADQGQLEKAVAVCDAHLDQHGPSAEAYCLLGLVRDAGGQADEAEACYRKALYLDPRHADAVTRLALLVERRGGVDEAKVLWNRARRLAGGSPA